MILRRRLAVMIMAPRDIFQRSVSLSAGEPPSMRHAPASGDACQPLRCAVVGCTSPGSTGLANTVRCGTPSSTSDVSTTNGSSWMAHHHVARANTDRRPQIALNRKLEDYLCAYECSGQPSLCGGDMCVGSALSRDCLGRLIARSTKIGRV